MRALERGERGVGKGQDLAGVAGVGWAAEPRHLGIRHLHRGRAEPGQLSSPGRRARLLGELPELGLDAAVPHAHAGQRGADVPRGTCRGGV